MLPVFSEVMLMLFTFFQYFLNKKSQISIYFIAILTIIFISGCANKVIIPTDQAKLDQGNYSDLNNHYKKLPLGHIAPTFSLPDAQGNIISLTKINQEQAVLLVFYRGDWCPYCIDQLSTIAAVLPEMEAQGVQVIAITPDEQAMVQNTQRRFGQNFILLSDPNAKVIKQYGVSRPNKLPHPAVYLLKPGGELAWFYSSSDYKKRPNGEQLLMVIKSHL